MSRHGDALDLIARCSHQGLWIDTSSQLLQTAAFNGPPESRCAPFAELSPGPRAWWHGNMPPQARAYR